jgi:rod shape-determining protein MreB
MIVNIGGGITEAAVMTMNNIVRAESGRVGGLKLDDAIIAYIRRKYSLTVGQPTAESAKIQVGAAVNLGDELTMEVQGRDNVTGLPRTITLTTGEVVEAIQEPLSSIADVVRRVLAQTPPELASDIIDRGIVLTGGGALLRGIDQFLTQQVKVPVYRAENAMIAVAVGAGRALNDPALLRRIATQN